MRRLSDEIYEIYYDEKIRKRRNLLFYTLGCNATIQMLIGNEESFNISFIVSLISGALACIHNKIYKVNKPYYEESIEKLKNVVNELILLGYDLEENALEKSTLWSDGLIEYNDKYDNTYFIYQDAKNKNDVRYYFLISNDVGECLSDCGMREDITEIINKGLSKSKQNK